MAVGDIVPVPGTRFEDTLESASPDLLREMIRGFAQRMMVRRSRGRVRGRVWGGRHRAGELPQRLPAGRSAAGPAAARRLPAGHRRRDRAVAASSPAAVRCWPRISPR